MEQIRFLFLNVVCCAYVLYVSTMIIMLLNGDVTFVGLLSSCVWFDWLMVISCEMLLLMEMENERMAIG